MDVPEPSLQSSLGWAPFPRALWENPSPSRGADVDLHICMFLASDEIRRCIFNQSLQRGWALEGRRGNVTAKRVWAWETEALRAEPCLSNRSGGLAGLSGWQTRPAPAPALAVYEPWTSPGISLSLRYPYKIEGWGDVTGPTNFSRLLEDGKQSHHGHKMLCGYLALIMQMEGIISPQGCGGRDYPP